MFDLDFKGKHIVLMDASFDLGPAIQDAFLDYGGVVSAITSEPAQMRDPIENLDSIELSEFDRDSILHTINGCIKRRGAIDIFIFNDKRALHPRIPIWEYSNEDWNTTYEHNVNRAFYFTKAIVPNMVQAGKGTILFLSTTSSYITLQEEFLKVSPAYESSNAALNRLAKHLAKDLGKNGINVNTLCPGNVDKPAIHSLIQTISRQSEVTTEEALLTLVGRQAIKELIPQEDIIYQVLHLCSKYSKYITGEDIIISGGLGL